MPPEQNPVPSQTITPSYNPPVQNQVPEIVYAGFWLRYLALTLDNIIVGIPLAIIAFLILFLVALITGENSSNPSTGFKLIQSFVYIAQIIAQICYFVILTNKRQATIGKRLLGLKVLSEEGSTISLGKIILRETIGKLVSGIILGIGFLMAAFTSKKQALHDIMSGSVVISNRAERKSWAFVLSIVIAAGLPIVMVGILSSVVLVSFSTARSKALDAYVESSLGVVSSEAQIVHLDNNSSYKTLCEDPVVVRHLTEVESRIMQKTFCNATDSGFAVYIPLKTVTSGATGLCVDGISYIIQESKEPMEGATSCQ
jgi:uncharacterized RDD family membrane protein YckC